MRRFALFMVVMAFFTHFTEVRSPSKIDGVGQTNANATLAQKQAKMGRDTPGKTIAQKVYIDPETGEIVTPPEHETPAASESINPSALSISAETMEEESSPVSGGGVMIDLKGRFHNPVSATIGGTGKNTIEHPASDRME